MAEETEEYYGKQIENASEEFDKIKETLQAEIRHIDQQTVWGISRKSRHDCERYG